MAGLVIQAEQTSYRISGNTYAFKDAIKALPGATWNPAEKAWRVPLATDLAPLQAAVAADAACWKVPFKQPHGRCCAAAVVTYDVPGRFDGPYYYLCQQHGKRWPTAKGCYTGD